MALQGCHVNSHMGMRLSRYLTNHPAIDNAGYTEDGERVAYWQQPGKTMIWEQEVQGSHLNPLTQKG